MSNGTEGYTVKEMLALMEASFNRRFDKLEQKMDESVSRAEWVDVASRVTKLEIETLRREGPVADRIIKMETKLEELEDESLSPVTVREMIGNALQDASARGWTSRERFFGIVIILVSIGTFVINIIGAFG